MAMKHDYTPGMPCQDRYQIRRIDQCQTNTLTQADLNQRIFDNLVMEENKPGMPAVLQNQPKRFQLGRADDPLTALAARRQSLLNLPSFRSSSCPDHRVPRRGS
jgi:hypothetical protein